MKHPEWESEHKRVNDGFQRHQLFAFGYDLKGTIKANVGHKRITVGVRTGDSKDGVYFIRRLRHKLCCWETKTRSTDRILILPVHYSA